VKLNPAGDEGELPGVSSWSLDVAMQNQSGCGAAARLSHSQSDRMQYRHFFTTDDGQ